MRYFVKWIGSAHDRLERIWMVAEDKRAVLQAAGKIDHLLENDLFRTEAIMLGDENTLIVEPLAVDFEVMEAEKKVLVLDVWMIGFLDLSR